jgi:hypothetical protein
MKTLNRRGNHLTKQIATTKLIETSASRCRRNNMSNLTPSAMETAGPHSVVCSSQGGHQCQPAHSFPHHGGLLGVSHTCQRCCTHRDVPPPRVPPNLPFNDHDLTGFAIGRPRGLRPRQDSLGLGTPPTTMITMCNPNVPSLCHHKQQYKSPRREV